MELGKAALGSGAGERVGIKLRRKGEAVLVEVGKRLIEEVVGLGGCGHCGSKDKKEQAEAWVHVNLSGIWRGKRRSDGESEGREGRTANQNH